MAQNLHKMEQLQPAVHETVDGNVRVAFGDFLIVLFDPENAGKFVRKIETILIEIERKRQAKIPRRMVISAMVEGNPLRKSKEGK